MKEILLNLQFSDEYYQEIEEVAKRLNRSVEEVIAQFVEEGLADWTWIEHEEYEFRKIEEAREKLNDLVR